MRNKELNVFNPIRRTRRSWSDRAKNVDLPLLAGYVLCHFGFAQRMAVLTTPSVTPIVSAGKQPGAVSDGEIAAVQAIVASGRHATPWPCLSVGRQVQVASGCLAGLCGIVLREKNDFRVVVSVDHLQRSIAVEIDYQDQPPSPAAAGFCEAPKHKQRISQKRRLPAFAATAAAYSSSLGLRSNPTPR